MQPPRSFMKNGNIDNTSKRKKTLPTFWYGQLKMFENKQLCFSLFLDEYRVKKVAFSGFFHFFWRDELSQWRCWSFCAWWGAWGCRWSWRRWGRTGQRSSYSPSLRSYGQTCPANHLYVYHEAGQDKNPHVLPHCYPVVTCALQTIRIKWGRTGQRSSCSSHCHPVVKCALQTIGIRWGRTGQRSSYSPW